MFGLNEALMSFIRRQVGLRTDAASPTGSLHAKVGNIAANVTNVVSKVYAWKETNPYIIYQKVSAGSTVTLLSITSGSGFLLGVTAHADQDPKDYTLASVRITIDGTDKTEGFIPVAGTNGASSSSVVSYNTGIAGPLRFNSSIRIQGRSDYSAGANTHWVVTYCLD